jgi:hypothetical protein
VLCCGAPLVYCRSGNGLAPQVQCSGTAAAAPPLGLVPKVITLAAILAQSVSELIACVERLPHACSVPCGMISHAVCYAERRAFDFLSSASCRFLTLSSSSTCVSHAFLPPPHALAGAAPAIADLPRRDAM